MRLSNVLRLLLKKPRLTYLIRDDALVITSPKSAAKNQTIKWIALPQELIERKESVVKALMGSLRLETWNMRGGMFEVAIVGDSLRVVGHERLFDHVESFLITMQESDSKESATKLPEIRTDAKTTP